MTASRSDNRPDAELVLFDRKVDFKDGSGGLRVIVFDDDTVRLQVTGLHAAKIVVRVADLVAIDRLFAELLTGLEA